MKTVLLSFMCLMLTNLPAQVYSFSRRIIDQETREPIANAVVYFQDNRVYRKLVSGPDGVVVFENVSANPFAKYTIAVQQSGYEYTRITGPLVNTDDIELKKAGVVYIQLQSDDGAFMPGIELRHQESKVVSKTDAFGFAALMIPQNADPDKIYQISIHGGLFYHDEVIRARAADLMREVKVQVLHRKLFDYNVVRDSLIQGLNLYHELLKQDKPERSAQIYKCNNIYYEISRINSLSQEDQKDRANLQVVLGPELNRYLNLELEREEIERLEKKFTDEMDLFRTAYNHYKTGSSYASIPSKVDEMLKLVMQALKTSMYLYCIDDTRADLVNATSGEIMDLLRHLDEVKDRLPGNLRNRAVIITAIDQVFETRSAEFEGILKSHRCPQ